MGEARPRPLDGDDIGTGDLMAIPQPVRGEVELCRGDRAVALDVGRVVARAEAAIQRGERPTADAALAGEERVADSRIAVERAEHDRRWETHSPPALDASAKPAGAGRPGEDSARTLNKLPLSAGSIKRLSPLSRSARCAWLARAVNLPRRASAPSTSKNRPCRTGPPTAAPPASADAAQAAQSTWA